MTVTPIYSTLCFNLPKAPGNYSCLLTVRLWTDLTLCSVWSLFRFLSSSCFFFSILASKLASSETTLLSMSLVFSTLSLTTDTKAWWQIQCHFIDKKWMKQKNGGCQDKYIPEPPWWQLSGPFQFHWSPGVWRWLQFSFPAGTLRPKTATFTVKDCGDTRWRKMETSMCAC